ncbi:hypothetical protein QQX98_003157 [Neonectria punicea]|uniref:DNA2/NAM7 helicase-like C-terminal domain-containing protein n=1 Tax=Neonectria punicea TaxID=979145 RepID=A0ABR1HF78_9HYPO
MSNMDIETKTTSAINTGNAASVVDHDKKPAVPQWQGLRRVPDKLPLIALLILVVELGERFAYFGLSGPIQNYINNPYDPESDLPGALGKGQAVATALGNFFKFWAYASTVIGAIIADQYLGKFKAIMFACGIYIVGLVILVSTSTPTAITNNAGLGGLIAAMVTIGLGTGGIKANVTPLCAEQYTNSPVLKTLKSGEEVIVDPELTVQRLFMWFYWVVNIGALSPLITVNIEAHHSFWLAYLVPLIAIILSTGVFFLGRKKYVRNPPMGSAILDACRTTSIAIKEHGFNNARPSALRETGQERYTDDYVDDVQRGLKSCKMFLFFPFYFICWNQMWNNLISQAGQMALHGTPNDLLQNLDPIALCIFIPFLDLIVYPFLRKHKIDFDPVTRIFMGFMFASISMAYACVLQHYIYNVPPSSIHVWIQAPSYILVAFSEAFVIITGLELAFTQAPKNLRSVISALFWSTIAVAAAICIALGPVSQDPYLVWMYGTRFRQDDSPRGGYSGDASQTWQNSLLGSIHGDKATPERRLGQPESEWKLNLSLTFWFLVVLGSPAVRPLPPDDNKALHGLRRKIDHNWDLAKFHAVATGKITWKEFKKGRQVTQNTVFALMKKILGEADLLCTTPAMTSNAVPYFDWKKNVKGVAMDEAGNMNRADLACIWGNCLLPCFLGGDPKQLAPRVVTNEEKDADANFLNRHSQDGKISPLEFLQATGIPSFRLRTQLRMAEGLFDAVAAEVYPDVPFTYATSCQINLPRFATGQALEAYVLAKYPEVKPSPAGKLGPVFVHCQGSKVYANEMTGTKCSPDQVKIALDLAADFVKTKNANPADFVILAPDMANVDIVAKMRKRVEYSALLEMPPALTVEGYQGKESDVVITIMGNNANACAARLDEHRLNVMLTRRRCGLVIVGDINATGSLVEKGKGKGKGPRFGPGGKVYWGKAGLLRNLHIGLWKAGRVAQISVRLEVEVAGPSSSADTGS